MTEKIQHTLSQLFDQHRLIFWYDDKAEMPDLFETLIIEGVEKVEIRNNEFGIKYKVLIESPDRKFLIYQRSPKADDSENWLLDLNLAYYEFHTEPSSLYLHDLGLPQEHKALVQEHIDFFNSKKRIDELKALLEPGDTEQKIKIKMLCVLTGSEPHWEKMLFSLFSDVVRGRSDRWQSIEKYGLANFFWQRVDRDYAYKENNPTLKDLLINLLKDNFQRSLKNGRGILSRDAYLFVNRWKENAKALQTFAQASTMVATDLNIERLVEQHSAEELIDDDTFEVIDKKVIKGILQHLMYETLSHITLKEWILKREQKFFFGSYQKIYRSLFYASSLLDEIKKTNLRFSSVKEGFELYTRQYYQVDFFYRKYIYYSEVAEHQNVLKDLTEKVEKAYANTFLQALGDEWQKKLDTVAKWEDDRLRHQQHFFALFVRPFVQKQQRIFVVISDALRYESAAELRDLLLKEDRYSVDINAMLGSLPSYTQLGMASLLPHTDLKIQPNSDVVLADGLNTQGTQNRTKVLEKACKGIAISSEEFLRMNAHRGGREFVKNYDVIYIYSNCIDKTGDDRISEHKVFRATEEEFENLLKVIRQVANMNGTNMIITADHGYLYQHNALEKADFSDFKPEGNVYRITKRFIMGDHLTPHPMMMHFNGEQLHLNRDVDVLIPKSVTRLRAAGSGSRYVHGGASLQEIVIPVLAVNKGRRTDLAKVEVDVIGSNRNITSNQFGVVFYQMQPVAEKTLQRVLRISFCSPEGKTISDIHTINFNVTDSDGLSREKRQTFIFTNEASRFNGQDVTLRLEEPIEGTNQHRMYKEYIYRMLITFGGEFDEL